MSGARRDFPALLAPLLSHKVAQPKPIVMGILNVTPDSFSDGGEFVSPETAARHAIRMASEGADIIDVGGESTRPAGKTYGAGFQPISTDEEILRVIPVIEAIRSANSDLLISIDTQKARVAELAHNAGADIINDVSAGTSDAEMFSVAAQYKVPIVLMHGHGPDFTRSIEDCIYADVVNEVHDYLAHRIAEARNAGIQTILADVGIGFSKTYEDNLTLIRNHSDFLSLHVPLIIGVSRKSTIGKAMGNNASPKERIPGSIAAACYAVEHGASIVRTHDVKETREALNVMQEIMS